MPFNNEGLWTPDVTVGQAPLAGLQIGNEAQSYQNFQQTQAAQREKILLDMLRAGSETGVDVGASPTSQRLESTFHMGQDESSNLYHQLPQQRFMQAYSQLSDEDKKNPDKIDALAYEYGMKEQPWMSQQRRNAIAQEKADTAAKGQKAREQDYENHRIAAIQRQITNSMKENQKQFEGPQQAAQSAVDQIMARGDIKAESSDKLYAWAQSLPTKWPEGSQIGAGVGKTQATTADTKSKTHVREALLPGQLDLQKSAKAVADSRAAYLAAMAGKAGVMSQVAQREIARKYFADAGKHLDNLRKNAASQTDIDEAQREYEKAQKAYVSAGVNNAPAAVVDEDPGGIFKKK
jgi:hypothetical protein